MLHRFEAKSAPKVFLLPAVPVLLLGGSTVPFFLGQALLGLVAIAASSWISFHIIRYTLYQFRSHVRTTDEELVCVTSMGVENRIQWSEVTHAGTFHTERAGTFLFAYSESGDDLLTIPPYYSEIDLLAAELKERSDTFLNLSGRTPDHIADELRPLLDSVSDD